MARRYYQRYNTAERICHWLVAGTFLILLFSGLGLYDKNFLSYFDFLGGGANAILLHKVTGVIFLAASIVLFVQHWRDTVRFDADDAAWFACLGGYLSKDKEGPPMGKFNTGQKVFGIFVFLATLGLAATGWVIWNPLTMPRGLVQVSLFLHSLFFVLTAVGVVIHFYLGTVGNPGTIEGILYGEVSDLWAKKHAPKWVRELEER